MLSHSDVIQIDATVIIGLVILMSFQSFASPFIATEMNVFFERLSDLEVEYEKNRKLLLICEDPEVASTMVSEKVKSKFQDMCTDLMMEDLKLIEEYNALLKWGKNFGYLEESGPETPFVLLAMWGPFYVNIINFAMIIPFAVSAIIESFKTIKKNEDPGNASPKGIKIMMTGFFLLIAGFLVIVTIFYLSAVPIGSIPTDLSLPTQA